MFHLYLLIWCLLLHQRFVSVTFLLQVVLDVDDVTTILNTLVYDGKVEKSVFPDGSNVYRAIETLIPSSGLVQVPCGICPLIQRCNSSGLITPQVCNYMTEWLE